MPIVVTNGVQMTGGDLINSALRRIGVLASGEVPSGNESADAQVILNDLMDAFGADRLMIFTVQSSTQVPLVLKQVYTLGLGGDFNIPRPAKITGMSVLNLANAVEPLELPMDYHNDELRWAREIPVKNLTNNLPSVCYDDEQFPLRNLNIWPIPNVTVNFIIYFWQALSQFIDLITQYSFPPAYARMLKWNLALELFGEFGGDPQKFPMIEKQAILSMAAVKAMNIRPITIGVDPALIADGENWNWLTGEYSPR
jgi:hypothetical protein